MHFYFDGNAKGSTPFWDGLMMHLQQCIAILPIKFWLRKSISFLDLEQNRFHNWGWRTSSTSVISSWWNRLEERPKQILACWDGSAMTKQADTSDQLPCPGVVEAPDVCKKSPKLGPDWAEEETVSGPAAPTVGTAPTCGPRRGRVCVHDHH